jgi:hypothetical protein
MLAMDIWLRRCLSFEEEADADREFWARFSPDERVSILEQMRREWLERNGRVDEGLRRVARGASDATRLGSESSVRTRWLTTQSRATRRT